MDEAAAAVASPVHVQANRHHQHHTYFHHDFTADFVGALWAMVYDHEYEYEDPPAIAPDNYFSVQQRTLLLLCLVYSLLIGVVFIAVKTFLWCCWSSFRNRFSEKDRFTITNSVVSSLIVSPLLTLSYAPAWWDTAWELEHRFDTTCPWVIRAFVLHGAISLFEIGGYLLTADLNPLKYLHHLCAIVFLVAGLGQSQVHFFIYTGGLLEGSNFFLGIYYIQKILKKHNIIRGPGSSPAEILNGICLWAAYLVFRVLPLGYSFVAFVRDSVYDFEHVWETAGRRRWLLVAGCIGHVFLSFLSFMWFWQISKLLARGVASALCPKRNADPPQASATEQDQRLKLVKPKQH